MITFIAILVLFLHSYSVSSFSFYHLFILIYELARHLVYLFIILFNQTVNTIFCSFSLLSYLTILIDLNHLYLLMFLFDVSNFFSIRLIMLSYRTISFQVAFFILVLFLNLLVLIMPLALLSFAIFSILIKIIQLIHLQTFKGSFLVILVCDKILQFRSFIFTLGISKLLVF